MPFPTFTPPIAPSPGTPHKRIIKLREAEFGDGYSQPTPHGLNHIRRQVDLRWEALTTEQMQAIDQFFFEQGGNETFWFQPFGATAPVKWTCRDWSPNSDDGIWSMSATLIESFTAE